MTRLSLEEIQKKHEKLLKRFNNKLLSGSGDLTDEEVSQVNEILETLAQAGAYIEDSDQRSQLRAWIRYWTSFANDNNKIFPVSRLQPFDASLIHSRLTRHKMTRRQLLIGPGIAVGVLVVGGIVYWEAGRNKQPAPSPTPTPTSSPLTATPTPSPASSPPSVLISAPTDGSQVSMFTTVKGIAQNIPKDEELWLFIVPPNQASYFPQPGPIKILGDKWSIDAHFGVASDVGLKFTLIPVLINQNDQEAHNAIKKYFQQPGPVYRGIQSTSGVQLIFPEITVVRV